MVGNTFQRYILIGVLLLIFRSGTFAFSCVEDSLETKKPDRKLELGVNYTYSYNGSSGLLMGVPLSTKHKLYLGVGIRSNKGQYPAIGNYFSYNLSYSYLLKESNHSYLGFAFNMQSTTNKFYSTIWEQEKVTLHNVKTVGLIFKTRLIDRLFFQQYIGVGKDFYFFNGRYIMDGLSPTYMVRFGIGWNL